MSFKKGCETMSTLKRLSLLSPYLSQIDRATFIVHDSINTSLNMKTLRLSYKAYICTTADILHNYGYSDSSQEIRLLRLTSYLIGENPSVVLKNAKLCYDLLLDFVSGKRPDINYITFKELCNHSSVVFDNTGSFLDPISRLLSKVLSDRPCFHIVWKYPYVKEIKILLQYFGFLSKLPLSNTVLEEEALSDYLLLENNYPVIEEDNIYLKPLTKIIKSWLINFKYDGSLCRNGTGAVADAKAYQYDKYENMHVDKLLTYLYNREGGLGLWDYLPLGSTSTRLERCSKLVFVPKNVTKLRSISMEPASLQFVQQGVMRALYRFFKKQKFLKNHIKLEDQFLNRSLAYDGSITNKYATIDLSSASDLVSYDLVKRLFCTTPELYRWILGTRSTKTKLPDDTKINLKKFAPMGSALCFPIETLIFCACAYLAVLIAKEQGLIRDNETGIYTEMFSVYGDDIIVPLGAYDICCHVLNSLGFRINSEKSYSNSPFKESCGGNYLCGLDVTPIRWKVSFEQEDDHLDSSVYSSMCSFANDFEAKNYRVARCFCLKWINEFHHPIFTDKIDVSPKIHSLAATNFHLKQRYNRNYQRLEVKASIVKPIAAKLTAYDEKCDCINYNHWLRAKDIEKRALQPVMPESSMTRTLRKVASRRRETMSNNMAFDEVACTLNLDICQPSVNLGIQEKLTVVRQSWVEKPQEPSTMLSI